MKAIKISGPDAEKFLQGQVTCNVMTLVEDKPQPCALCNRKGRVIASFNLIKNNNIFYMILSEPMIAIVLEVLSKYAKFSKTTLEQSDPNYPDDYLMNEINPENSEKFTPHKLNYPLIPGMIDFNKGCYTGQEIIARVHYLSKKTPLPLPGEGPRSGGEGK
jgi:hypothetical protein